MLPGLLARRRALAVAVFALYLGLVFLGLQKIEVPGLGIGHFLYVPVVLLALSYGPRWGAGLGAISAVIYVIASALNTHFEPDEQALSISSGNPLLAPSSSSAGWSAQPRSETASS